MPNKDMPEKDKPGEQIRIEKKQNKQARFRARSDNKYGLMERAWC